MRLSPLFAIALLLCASAAQADPLKIGEAPTLQFTSIDGQKIDLASYKGKLVLVDFWATFSPVSVTQETHSVQLFSTYKDKGLVVLGISLEESPDAAAAVAKKVGMTWPIACDGKVWKSDFVSAFGVDAIPMQYLLGPDGKVMWARTGADQDIDTAIANSLKAHPIAAGDRKEIADANSQLDSAEKDFTDNNPDGAIDLLANISPAAAANPQIAKRIKDDQARFADAASASLTQVDDLVRDLKYPDAVRKLNSLIKAYSGTNVGDQARARLSALMKDPDFKTQSDPVAREHAAADLLQAAQNLQAQGDDVTAYKRFRDIVDQYPGTNAANTAAQAVAVYEKDPAFLDKVKEAAAAEKAKGALSVGDLYRDSGHPDQARQKYQSVIDDYPGTSFADTARQRLKDLDAGAGNGGNP